MKNVFSPTHKVVDSNATRMFQAAFKDRWSDIPVTTTSKSATGDLSSLEQADKIRVEAWVNRYMSNYDISVKIKGGTNSKVEDADLSEKGRDDLPKSAFGIPSERKFPMPDAEHVRSAASYFHTAEDKFKPELAKKILSKAKEFGVDITSDEIEKWAKKKADTKRKVRDAEEMSQEEAEEAINSMNGWNGLGVGMNLFQALTDAGVIVHNDGKSLTVLLNLSDSDNPYFVVDKVTPEDLSEAVTAWATDPDSDFSEIATSADEYLDTATMEEIVGSLVMSGGYEDYMPSHVLDVGESFDSWSDLVNFMRTNGHVSDAKVKDGIDYNMLDKFGDPDRAQAYIKTFMLNAADAEELKESAQYTYTMLGEGSWQVLRPKELSKYGYSQEDVAEIGIEAKDFVLMPV